MLAVMFAPKPESISEKLLKELEDGILVMYRVTNHRVDYSVMNRPEPTVSGVDDHMLATALVYAGRRFTFEHDAKLSAPERVARDDGREVTYNETIDIDFEKRLIRSTRRKDMTLKVLAAVIAKLMATASPTSAAVAKAEKAN